MPMEDTLFGNLTPDIICFFFPCIFLYFDPPLCTFLSNFFSISLAFVFPVFFFPLAGWRLTLRRKRDWGWVETPLWANSMEETANHRRKDAWEMREHMEGRNFVVSGGNGRVFRAPVGLSFE